MDLLREHDDFRRLWLAQTISQIGGQITYLALPLTAALTLKATPMEMGLLTAMGAAPALVVGLLAGGLVDRRERRPILIVADIARAVLLAMIPLIWLTGRLNMPVLYIVAFLSGVCALFFDIAYQAFVPALLGRRRLVEGNSLLELSRSASEMIGPALGGGLVQILKAPVAIAADALSFLASALLIARIRTPEERPPAAVDEPSLWRSSLRGVREVADSPPLRALAVSLAAIGLFNATIEAVVILYLTRTVDLQPGVLGGVFAVGSIGFVVGAMLPARMVRVLGVGPTLAVSIGVVGLSDLALPLAGQDVRAVAIAFGVGQFFFGLGLTVFRVVQVSIRQALVPDALLGRVGGAFNLLGWGIAPLGALAGGLLGYTIGLWGTLVFGAVCEAAVAIVIRLSPLWTMHDVPLIADAEG